MAKDIVAVVHILNFNGLPHAHAQMNNQSKFFFNVSSPTKWPHSQFQVPFYIFIPL